MAKHNKKRNVGLLHEQLVRHASEMTVEGKSSEAEAAIKILVNSFSKGTALLREFRLFSALVHPRVDNPKVARRIIEESRRACKDHDVHTLNKEKSSLIREINHTINRKDFYNQRIDDYKIFSTIQALLNEWRGKGSLNPKEIVDYELFLERHLTRAAEPESLDKAENADPLIFNVMIEKFNKKYARDLSDQQRSLLESHLSGDVDSVESKAKLIKIEALKSASRFFEECDNSVLNSKKENLFEKINQYVPGSTDEAVARGLMLSDLIKELEEKDV